MITMGFLSQHKLVIILAVVVAGFAWWGLSGTGTSSPASLLTTKGVGANLNHTDQSLVATLLQLRAVKLDGTIFSEPAFAALKDFSTQIISEPVGRPNPFEPLTLSGASTASSTHSSAIFTPGR